MFEEAFYRDSNGSLVFRAIGSVGATNAVSFAHAYAWGSNGFPTGKPTDMGKETIWAAHEYDEGKTKTGA